VRGLDLFSGIGGASIAMQRAGIEVVAHAEIEPFCCQVSEHHFPNIPNLGDVAKITAEALQVIGDPDIVSFGSPCQDWSVAGKRLGLKGHRSSLFHEAIRIIRLCKPRFAVFENVPGLFSSAGGWDFAAVLDEMAESGALDIAWRVLDAQWFGVPQRRRRIFLVADFRGERAGEILSISEGVFRHPAPSREAREKAAGGSGDGFAFALRGRDEGARVEVSGERTSSIRGEGGSGRDYVASVAPNRRSNPYGDHDACEGHLVAGGQRTRYGKGVNTSVDDGAIIPIQDGLEIEKNQNGLGIGSEGDPAYTLDSLNTQAVALHTTQDPVVGRVSPAMGTGTTNGYGSIGTLQGMGVRRLTPRECERLQGFPDDWTNIKGTSDSARYRALGNAWAVPVGECVMCRVVEVAQ
jgi:DNA (cytosine-5)-methyltransferase 1